MTIYLDCNATTPIDPEVLKVVRHYMEVDFGNAGSRTHEYGLRAKKAVEKAREQVAEVVKAKPDEVIFTSGATESNNLAILGLEEEGRRSKRMHLISTQIEHKAVLEPMEEMRRRGFEVTLLPPNRGGWVEPERLAEALRPDTLLVSIMHVNNETGVIQSTEDYCKVLAGHEAYLHVDAAQGFGKVGGLEAQRIDLISISGHKVFAPKGVGALITRRRGWHRVPLMPLMFGGGQERGLRPGTVPVHLVAGLGEAAAMASRQFHDRRRVCCQLRQHLLAALCSDEQAIIGAPDRHVPSCVSVSLQGVDSEALILAMGHLVAVSNGAACTSSGYHGSHVISAMYGHAKPLGVIRFSWSHLTSIHDMSKAAKRFQQALRLRDQSSFESGLSSPSSGAISSIADSSTKLSG